MRKLYRTSDCAILCVLAVVTNAVEPETSWVDDIGMCRFSQDPYAPIAGVSTTERDRMRAPSDRDWQHHRGITQQIWRRSGAIAILALVMLVLGPKLVWADPLTIVYPPENHQTRSESVFFIGTAPPDIRVTINGREIDRSTAGHFAPSVPLAVGANTFTFLLQPSGGASQTFTRTVTRLNPVRSVPLVAGLLSDTIAPSAETWKQAGDLVCFDAIGAPNAEVEVQLWEQSMPMVETEASARLPAANAILTDREEAIAFAQPGFYRGCLRVPEERMGQSTIPKIVLTLNGTTVEAEAGRLEVLDPQQPLVVQTKVDRAIARNGPSSSFIRYSPWPIGTRATVAGRENDWFETTTGRWVAHSQVDLVPASASVRTTIGSSRLQRVGQWTELQLPMTAKVPFNVTEEPGRLILDVDNARLQTDFFRMEAEDPLVDSVSWSQEGPERVRYVLHLKRDFAWGYEVDYVGTTLVLRLRQVPGIDARNPLRGLKIAIDPGHGGEIDLGARGPDGTTEAELNIRVSEKLVELLSDRGAATILTRTEDVFVPLADRARIQDDLKPDLFLSIHHNALPDSGDAEQVKGIQTFWYYPHSRELAAAQHLDLIRDLEREDAGFFYSSLAVIRATPCPSVLLELGYMISPDEFEAIASAEEQWAAAAAIVSSLERYLQQVASVDEADVNSSS